MKNTRFQFPGGQQQTDPGQQESPTKSDLELKREMLRKKKEELEKKLKDKTTEEQKPKEGAAKEGIFLFILFIKVIFFPRNEN